MIRGRQVAADLSSWCAFFLFEVVVVCYVDSSSVQNFLYHLIIYGLLLLFEIMWKRSKSDYLNIVILWD